MRSKRELENGTDAVDTQARFLGLLMMPGSSGSYASSNSFYLYGKLVNSAVSLSYAPVQAGNFPRPIAAATADDPASAPNVPTAPIAPTRIQSVLNGVQRFPTRSGNQYFNTFVPSFYPYYLFPYNFSPYRRTNESKSIPIEKLGSESKIG